MGGGAGSTGGAVLLALISAVAFATILAVVAGLTLTSASSVAHDLYATLPLSNPGIISIPLGFFLGWLGTVTSKEPEAEDRFTALEVRAFTGAGSEGAIQH